MLYIGLTYNTAEKLNTFYYIMSVSVVYIIEPICNKF